MKAGTLQNLRVKTETGERLGRVAEIHLTGDRVSGLTYGARGLLQRFLPIRRGHRITWDQVRAITADEIVVAARSKR